MKARRAAAVCVCVAAVLYLGVLTLVAQSAAGGPTEAPAGFDNLTNGFVTQEEFDEALASFAEQEAIDDGLGPVYNAQSCGECHQNPVTGGASQISELRAGHTNLSGDFVDAPPACEPALVLG